MVVAREIRSRKARSASPGGRRRATGKAHTSRERRKRRNPQREEVPEHLDVAGSPRRAVAPQPPASEQGEARQQRRTRQNVFLQECATPRGVPVPPDLERVTPLRVAKPRVPTNVEVQGAEQRGRGRARGGNRKPTEWWSPQKSRRGNTPIAESRRPPPPGGYFITQDLRDPYLGRG